MQEALQNGNIVDLSDRQLSKDEIEINTHTHFSYVAKHNVIKIEMIDIDKEESKNNPLGETYVTLSEIPLDKFVSRHYLFRNKAFLGNIQSYIHSLTRI